MKKTVVVAGAVGVIGRGVLNHFEHQDVELIALSRRAPDFPTRARHIAVDLTDRAACEAQLAQLTDATHLVFAAYQEKPTPAELVEVNLLMLQNLVETLETHAPGLQHVALMQGGKAYGAHIGPFPSPAKESDPRHMPPNFYYDQEDFLRSQSQGKSWSWTALRPEAVIGMAVGNPMNLLMVIAVYGSIAKALGVPMSFPGPRAAWDALYQVTDARILAKAIDWAGESPSCRGEIFNITNGDYFRWSRVWPRIAAFFDVPVGEPFPLSLQQMMADKASLWQQLTQQHGLQAYPYEKIVSWQFGDFILKTTFDNITSTIKARQHGFADCIDSEEMFIELLTQLRNQRYIP
ncbi:SDR family oxidoreductase [Mixta calida]|uniref:SDR family oxidoreductase n=1 Tax=Mixta calida TaxID=665913 RepID=UPI00053600F4|nr:SDR family oxidoreductase [Mixta calida]AIX74062.1 NAD-dependent dehydratase [Pantoea sp. PSNIH2]POU43000.1 NAD-dependent dehydratase [Pantoea sp. PSNIH5]POU61254.1 NAD-dependent dehydratase [Pantoea sp. PSNIH4]POY66208.1 NAD-dependent dehydratase [Pantoea sp. PSNIH3]KAF0859441.1 NAD-dependent dehydratase [Mixta calida B021323]